MRSRTLFFFVSSLPLATLLAMEESERKEHVEEREGHSESSAVFTTSDPEFTINNISFHKPLLCASLHPNNTILALSRREEEDQGPHFYNLPTKQYYCASMPAKKTSTTSISFSRHGTMLALGRRVTLSLSQLSLCTDVELPRFKCKKDSSFPHVPSFFRALQFNEDNTTLATASDDGAVRLWDIATSSCIRTVQEKSVVPAYALTYLDSHLLSFTNASKGVTLCDPRSPSVHAIIELHDDVIRALSTSLVKKRLVSGAANGCMRFSDIRCIHKAIVHYLPNVLSSITSLALHPEYAEWIVGYRNGVVKFYNDKNRSIDFPRHLHHQGGVAAVALTGTRQYTALSLGADGILTTYTAKEAVKERCSICLDEYSSHEKQSDRMQVALQCNHIFHHGCIKQALAVCNKKCPLCRGKHTGPLEVLSKKRKRAK